MHGTKNLKLLIILNMLYIVQFLGEFDISRNVHRDVFL